MCVCTEQSKHEKGEKSMSLAFKENTSLVCVYIKSDRIRKYLVSATINYYKD